jgi:hypothetical protein
LERYADYLTSDETNDTDLCINTVE